MSDPAAGLVLIVEDDAAIAEGLGLNLRLQGYRTDWAADGEAARDRIAGGQPDLVLLDISLPSGAASRCSRSCARPATTSR